VPVNARGTTLEACTTVRRLTGEHGQLDVLNLVVLPFMQMVRADWFVHLDPDEFVNLNDL